jgi:hypothetical protein
MTTPIPNWTGEDNISQWKYIKKYWNETIKKYNNQDHLIERIDVSSAGVTTNYVYVAGTIDTQGRIFLSSRSPHGTQPADVPNWHYINTYTSEVISYAHGQADLVDNSYWGGVLASNGRIYLIPFGQGNQTNWHYIDTNTDPPNVVSYAHGQTGIVNQAYLGGVLAPNGRIYMIPFGQSNQTNWHYIDTNTGTVSAYAHGVTAVANAYAGGVLAPDGKMYLVPYAQANQTNWHYIDTNTGTVSAYAHGATAVANAYLGGVLAPNGRIYLVPSSQGSESTWHYIDVSSSTPRVVGYSPSSSANTASPYVGGALAANGRIYLAPFGESSETEWHYIDIITNKVVAYTHSGITFSTSQFHGGTFAANGKLYFHDVANDDNYWYYIDTRSKIEKAIAINPYYNKF